MHIIIGTTPKGEVYVIGHTTSRAKADKWVATHPHGDNDEYAYVERQMSRTL